MQLFSVTVVQRYLGFGYTVVALIALVRLGDLRLFAVSIAVGTGAYLTARRVPEFQLPWSSFWRVAGIGVILLSIGLYADLAGGKGALYWASVALAYCAGNRFKAGSPSA